MILNASFESDNMGKRGMTLCHTAKRCVGQKRLVIIMVALWNRETIYIFMLWFVLSIFFFLA